MRQTIKLHRWIDLVTALLDRRYGLTLVELREKVPGYAKGRAESVRRTFERDKDELRRLGVPIDISGPDGNPEPRYILRANQFYMPYLSLAGSRGVRKPPRVDRLGYRSLAECDFTTDELAILAEAAARVQQLGEPLLARDASRAVAKLAIDIPESLEASTRVDVITPRNRCDPDVLVRLGDALLRRKQVSFTYYGIERDETERRTVLPYGLAYTSGHWYLHAQDPSRGALRLFRASRIRELEVNARTPGTPDFGVPDSFRLAERVHTRPPWELGEEPPTQATLRLAGDTGRVRDARKHGTTPRGSDLTHFVVRRREPFLRWVLGMAGDAVPVSPPDLVRDYHALVQRTIDAAVAP